ncbi:MAG: hypothetical protein PVF65_02135 [Sphingomonadales bacterium]|jgi:uncharacterized membrane protein
MNRFASIGLVGLLILYPLAVYYGLDHLTPATLGLCVAALGGLRLLLAFFYSKGGAGKGNTIFLAGFLIIAGLSFALTGHEAGLTLYPVAVNLFMLAVFSLSLTTKQPFVERIARLHKPDLPDQATPYLRKVTIAWSLFFLLNGIVAYLSAVYGSRTFWALYNGLIAYGLMGGMFAGEYIVRLFVMRRHAPLSQGDEA